jgi:hypothetical protein
MAPKKAAPKKAAAKKPAAKKTGNKGVELSYTVEANEKGAMKAGQDARKRAAQRGTPVSKTYVTTNERNAANKQPKNLAGLVARSLSDLAYGRGGRSQGVEATTTVKSSRGNLYQIAETKKQVKGGKDTGRRTTATPVTNRSASEVRTNFQAKSSKAKKKK